MRTSSTSLALAVILALAAAGCGSKSTPGAAKSRTAGPAHPVKPTEALSPYLVSAVVTGKAGAALLQLKFELGAHPEVGDTANVDVVIVPSADNIDQISGSIQGDDGLEVVDGGTIAPVEKAVFGAPIHHPLKVEAKHEGIFTLTASFTVKTGAESWTPVYSMPIIVGNGLADAGSTPAPAAARAKPPAAAAAQ
jgi:hypothetical protein